jgi:hypothetical protein
MIDGSKLPTHSQEECKLFTAVFLHGIYGNITFGSIWSIRFILLEEISGPIRVSVWVEDLIESRVTLVAVKELYKLFDGDVQLGTKPIYDK